MTSAVKGDRDLVCITVSTSGSRHYSVEQMQGWLTRRGLEPLWGNDAYDVWANSYLLRFDGDVEGVKVTPFDPAAFARFVCESCGWHQPWTTIVLVTHVDRAEYGEAVTTVYRARPDHALEEAAAAAVFVEPVEVSDACSKCGARTRVMICPDPEGEDLLCFDCGSKGAP